MTSFHHRIAYPSFYFVVTFFLFGGRHLGRGWKGRRALMLRWHSAALAGGFAAAEQDSHRHELGHVNFKPVNAQWKTGVQRAQLDGHASHMKSQEPPEFLERVEPET